MTALSRSDKLSESLMNFFLATVARKPRRNLIQCPNSREETLGFGGGGGGGLIVASVC